MATDNPYVAPKVDLKNGSRRSAQPSIMLWAIGIVFGSSFAGAALGTLVGFCLGTFAPGYYKAMFPTYAALPDFEPVGLGIGLGMTQGGGLGLFVGVLIVIAFFWHQSRLNRQ